MRFFPSLPLLCAALLTSCVSESDRALLSDMPDESRIRYRTVTEYGVTHRVRFVQLPF
jgi:hypothetical protein